MTAIRARLIVAVLLASALGCGGGEPPTGPGGPGPTPTTGSVRIIVKPTGLGADADGFTVGVGTASHAVAMHDTLVVAELAPGAYEVTLGGLSANCRITNPLAHLTVVAGGEASYIFAPTCYRPFSNQLLVSDHPGDIYVVGVNGGSLAPIIKTIDTEVEPAPSPDGTELAYTYLAEVGNGCGIRVADADGGNIRTLTNNPGFCDTDPAWSPDGSKIAYSHRGEAGASDIWIMNPDGSGKVNLTQTDDVAEEHPTWSPDGTLMVFEVNQPGGGLFLMNSDGTGRTPLTGDEDDASAAWSPAGPTIAYTQSRGLTAPVLHVGADGAALPDITPGDWIDMSPAWAPDGSRIVFARVMGPDIDVWSIRPDGTDILRVTTGRSITDVAWAR